MSNVWRSIQNIGQHPMQALWQHMAFHDKLRPFTPLGNSSQLVIASDYGGDHKSASHEVFSFVCVDTEASQAALEDMVSLRQSTPMGIRRFAYKQRRDAVRRRYLPEYLECRNRLHANCVTVAINRDAVVSKGKSNDPNQDPELLALIEKLNPVTRVKFTKIASIVALLVAGFSRPGQSAWWITDNDEIVEHDARADAAWHLAWNLIHNYALHQLEGFQLSTPSSSTRDIEDPKNAEAERLLCEDLLSVGDLIAGGFCSLLSQGEGQLLVLQNGAYWSLPVYSSISSRDAPFFPGESDTFKCAFFRFEPLVPDVPGVWVTVPVRVFPNSVPAP